MKKTKLKVFIEEDSIMVTLQDGIEVVRWVEDEWKEDPSIVPAIANAIFLSFYDPDELIKINQKHIDSQRNMQLPEN